MRKLTLRLEPPFASASTLVSMAASKPTALLNVSACSVASLPISESMNHDGEVGLDDALDLRELVHEVAIGLHPPRRIY